MSNPLRETNPPERPLAFDRYAAQQRRGPAPVTLILSLLILAGVGGGVFYLYRGGIRQPGAPPEPVGVPVRDVRVAAPPQAQQPDPAAGLSIYKDDPNATLAAPAFTPPPEQPTARPGAPMPTLSEPVATPASPVVSAQMKPATTMSGSVSAAPAPPATLVKPVKPAKTPSIDTLLASTTPSPTARKPDGAGGFVVQIGAFSSHDLADRSWSSAAGLAPGSMAGKGKHIAQVTKNDGTTLYRTDITGFDTREAALAMCAKLTVAGRTCFVR